MVKCTPNERRAAAQAELDEFLREIQQGANDVIRDASFAADAARTILKATELVSAPDNMALRLAAAVKALGELQDRTYNLERVAGNLDGSLGEAVRTNRRLAADDFA